MNLLFVTQRVDEQDPVLAFVCGWVGALARYFDHVVVLAGAVGVHSLPKNVEVYSLGKERKASKLEQIRTFECLSFQWLSQGKIDAVLAHMIPKYVLALVPVAKMTGTPMFLWYAHKAAPPELKLALPWLKRVFTSHPDSFPISTPKKIVLGQGIDTDLFQPTEESRTVDSEEWPGDGELGSPRVEDSGQWTVRREVGEWRSQTVRFCYVARLSPIKDQKLVIDATHLLQPLIPRAGHSVELVSAKAGSGRPGLEVHFVGDAYVEKDRGYKAMLEQKVQKYSLNSVIRFWGAMTHRELPGVLQNCDFGLCASHTTTLEKSALEMMACGLPTLVCNPALRELVHPWEEILFFKEGDAKDLADKMNCALELPFDQRRRIGRTLRQRVVEQHSVSRLAKRLFESIEEALGDKRPLRNCKIERLKYL